MGDTEHIFKCIVHLRRNPSLRLGFFFFFKLEKNCLTTHIFLPQFLGPVAAENSMCRPLNEIRSYDTAQGKQGQLCGKFISNCNQLVSRCVGMATAECGITNGDRKEGKECLDKRLQMMHSQCFTLSEG